MGILLQRRKHCMQARAYKVVAVSTCVPIDRYLAACILEEMLSKQTNHATHIAW